MLPRQDLALDSNVLVNNREEKYAKKDIKEHRRRVGILERIVVDKQAEGRVSVVD